jgi:hypothetical protein
MGNHYLVERKAHPPLGAGAEVYHGVEVVITENHVNRTAPSGWMVRLVRLLVQRTLDADHLPLPAMSSTAQNHLL